MPGKTNKTILLGMLLPGQERWPPREPPLGLPRTSRVRYLPPQLGRIRGMSDQTRLAVLRAARMFRYTPHPFAREATMRNRDFCF